jgi:hypothetical protein
MLFSFGRDVNINWKHGINALSTEEQNGKGRISIVLWGLVPNVLEEDESPPMLTDNTRGNGYSVHANQSNNRENIQRSGNGVCREWAAKRECKYGDTCKFSH